MKGGARGTADDKPGPGPATGEPADRGLSSGRPADWAWTGGLMDALLPTPVLRPCTIVAYQGALFTPEHCIRADGSTTG